jgi:hypothetical protein
MNNISDKEEEINLDREEKTAVVVMIEEIKIDIGTKK